jgi:acyl-CoA reductase-like NAD-dependent aldehyde dehydrogenase
VVNIVSGLGPAAGAPLVEHPDVRAISFTGSSEVGSLVAQRAAANFKQVSLEMGGKNAQIVLDDANLDLALDGALWGAFGTTGQRCTATSRILLQKGIAAEFTAEFVARAKKLKVGNGLDESVEVGPQVNAKSDRDFARYVEIAQAEGAKLLTGGHALTDGACANGTFFEPTVFAGVTPPCASPAKKSSAPWSSAHRVFDTFEEAIEIANSIDYGLSTSLYTKDVNRAFTAMRDLEAGITYINAPTIGAEVHLPFGGVKHTGNGHREGLGALDFFTTWKAVYVDYSDKLQRAQIDNAE